MTRRSLPFITASLIGLLSLAGPLPAATAQVPGLPGLPGLPGTSGPLAELLTGLTDVVSDLVPIGPDVFTDIDTSAGATVLDDDRGSEAIRVSGLLYNCSGLFLPLKGSDGPIDLDVTVTQRIGNTVTIGSATQRTPDCDGNDHRFAALVAANAGNLNGFFPGTAIVQVELSACDITGCNRWIAGGNVFVRT